MSKDILTFLLSLYKHAVALFCIDKNQSMSKPTTRSDTAPDLLHKYVLQFKNFPMTKQVDVDVVVDNLLSNPAIQFMDRQTGSCGWWGRFLQEMEYRILCGKAIPSDVMQKLMDPTTYLKKGIPLADPSGALKVPSIQLTMRKYYPVSDVEWNLMTFADEFNHNSRTCPNQAEETYSFRGETEYRGQFFSVEKSVRAYGDGSGASWSFKTDEARAVVNSLTHNKVRTVSLSHKGGSIWSFGFGW